MKIKLGRMSRLTVLISAIGLMCAFSASASADSITCEISGSIKLSPGLAESAQVQNIAVTMHKGAKLSGRAGTETTVTGGNVNIHMKTEKPVTCAALKSAGEAVTETNAIFKWNPKGQGNWMVTFTVPLTESPVSLGGKIATGSFPFSEDTISGSVTQKYTGTCGTGGGHGKGKKVNKGSLSGSITIS
jgi:hypothetical protein